MVRVAATLAAVLPFAAAYPAAMEALSAPDFRSFMPEKRQQKTDGRLNTGGGHPIVSFDAASQYVDVTDGGKNPYQAPGATDLRGECPGLNAAANHGFMPRNGKATILQTITGLGGAYNMQADLATALSVIAILISGDLVSMQWSIGGAFPSAAPLLLSPGKGILGTHNKYEGDASIIHGDAYQEGGSVGTFKADKWAAIMDIMGEENNLDFAKAAALSSANTKRSESTNPYYISLPFSGLVAPAAYDFVVTFMSNHSAETPGGFLTREVITQFFAVEGDNVDNYTTRKGQERIPLNWYKRPGLPNQYGNADVFIDLLGNQALYDNIIRFGGNTGTVNSFTGVNPADITGGTFNGAALTDPSKLACFFYRAAMAGGIDALDKSLTNLNQLLQPLNAAMAPIFAALNCEPLNSWNSQLFNVFPGYKYTGPADSNTK